MHSNKFDFVSETETKMFNSSFLSIETPQKRYIKSTELTPVKLHQVPERFSPSYSVRKVLKQVKRIHDFQYHEPVELKNLRDLNMNRKIGEEIAAFMVTTDVTDIISRLEEIAVESKYYDQCTKEYISEEFDCVIQSSHFQ